MKIRIDFDRLYGFSRVLTLIAAVLCLYAACVINPDSAGLDKGQQGDKSTPNQGTQADDKALSEGVWKDGNITKDGQIVEYTISVTAGTMYFIWWNDNENTNDRSKTCDVSVSARYSDGTPIFTGENTGWERPQLFTPDNSGTVFVSVQGYRSYSWSDWPKGTYAVRYTTHAGRTAILEDTWKDDSLIADSQVNEYSITVTNGTTYFIWWNDNENTNDRSKTCDVAVSARYSDGTTIFTGEDTGWQKPQVFTPARNDTVIISVRGYRPYSYSAWPTGTYAVKYTTRQSRIILSAANWVNDSLITDGQVNEYSFTVTSGTTYYIWWNDYGQGDSTKNCNVTVSARYGNGDTIFTNENSGWTTSKSFTANNSGTVIVSVQGYRQYSYSAWPIGTYAVAYTTTNSRPF